MLVISNWKLEILNMQYAVPQFTDVEDTLIWKLTLKQFLTLLATGGVVMFFWSIFGISIFFILFSLPVIALGAELTFASFNGRPLFAYFVPFLSFTATAKVRIFRREEATINFSEIQKQSPKKTAYQDPSMDSQESRLKKLAYLLDQKTSEEKELIKEIK